MSRLTPDRPVLLGVVTGAHGLKGDVRLVSFTSDPLAIGDYGPLTSKDGRSWRVSSLRLQKNGLVARLEGIRDRNAAEGLKGLELFIAREKLPEAEVGEYYHADLIGLEVEGLEGGLAGRVVAVHDFGAGDLLEIRLGDEDRSFMVPFTDEFVPKVDLGTGRLVVALPQGYLSDATKDGEEDGP